MRRFRIAQKLIEQSRGFERRGDSSESAPDETSIAVHRVAPEATDPEIDDWLDPHVAAFSPVAPRLDRLFLFLAGSFGVARRQWLFQKCAAQLGYHTINLTYPNAWTVEGLCRRSGDLDCHENVRLEIVDGRARSDLLGLRPANCIIRRLSKLLSYLERNHPGEGWGQYLGSDGPRWESVCAAGHSQGGGHAALIAKLHRLHRVILLAAPADHDSRTERPAPWLSKAGATPSDRCFGFAHLEDPGFARIQRSWECLGLGQFGPVVSVDQNLPPYGHTHRLVTNAGPTGGQRFHGAVVVDAVTPLRMNGTPLFQPAWEYLLGGSES